MFNGKFLITVIGIFLAFLLATNSELTGSNVIENWWGGVPAQTPIAVTQVQSTKSNTSSSLPGFGNTAGQNLMMSSNKFVTVPTYQSILSPRFSNVQYGANIRYNMPDNKNMASPYNPLSFKDMVKKDYVKEKYSCGESREMNNLQIPAGYTNGNYMDVYSSLSNGKKVEEGLPSDALPIGTMSGVNNEGEIEQFVMYNRLMNTNMKSRLRANSDYFRGDLMITPEQSGWFSVYPKINVDLNPGAMGVLSGYNVGESNSQLVEALIKSSGGARTTFGGVDWASAPPTNMTPSYNAAVSAANTDVTYTAFP